MNTNKNNPLDYPFLTEEEVRRRLASYEDTAITDDLLDFGKILVTESMDRINKLDAKANIVAVFAVGVISLLASTSGTWITRVHKLWVPIPVYGAIFALIAAFFALLAIRVRDYKWYSNANWLSTDCFSSSERLRKYRVLSAWAINLSHNKIAEEKAKSIVKAQWFLFVAALILVLSLINASGVF